MTLKAILATTACLLSGPAFAGGHVDLTNADATAVAVIEAFRAKDGPAVAALFNETNQRSVGMFTAMGPDSPEWADIWSDWRQAGLDVWGGKTLPARDRDGDGMTAVVPFAFDGPDGAVPLGDNCTADCRYLVIVLTRDSASDTTWGFEDINGEGVSSYAAATALN